MRSHRPPYFRIAAGSTAALLAVAGAPATSSAQSAELGLGLAVVGSLGALTLGLGAEVDSSQLPTDSLADGSLEPGSLGLGSAEGSLESGSLEPGSAGGSLGSLLPLALVGGAVAGSAIAAPQIGQLVADLQVDLGIELPPLPGSVAPPVVEAPPAPGPDTPNGRG